MKAVYIAHPLGAGADRETNRKKAAEIVAKAGEKGVAPIADWIILSGLWTEEKRDMGLAIDLALIERCDELWACGPRISEGMKIEIRHALNHRKPVFRMSHDLVYGDRIYEPLP